MRNSKHRFRARSDREALVRRIGELRALGLNWTQIGERLGYGSNSLSALYRNGGKWPQRAQSGAGAR